MDRPSHPGSELSLLNFLLGKWDSTGQVAGSLINTSIKIKGTDNYEWVAGGFFLLHRVDVMMGDEKVEAVEIIGGYDASDKTFPMRSFDNHGNFITMRASFEKEGVLMISGEKMRSKLVLNMDGKSMTANWERSEDGSTWIHWMDMQFSKAS